ncbi:MAG: hypothetical protein IT386_07460 [Deltaproteobacteria bacterium]|nr:hypothetical protein [Deltaproteobacteria bacterium]
MALRCVVVRGLVREVEEDLNKFLSANEVRVLHMSQSETGNHITITLIVDDMQPLG